VKRVSEIQPNRCSGCGAPLRLWLSSVVDAQSGELFGILRCARCRLGETFPRPINIGNYYGETYYGQRHGITADYCDSRRYRILERACGNPGRLLDIGCGEGTFLLAAQHQGWKVIGTEVGSAAAAAAARGIPIARSLEETNAASGFDAITMWHTLEHFVDPHAIVAQAGALLRPGGTLIVAVPNAGGLQATLFRSNWLHLDVPRHLFHFTQEALSHAIERVGLAVDGWHHQEFEYDLFGWLQSAINVLIPSPNTLFLSLTGKRCANQRAALVVSYALAALFAAPAVAATAVGTGIRRGGTLIAIARKP
jgi:SAM-dependent methyltransferase